MAVSSLAVGNNNGYTTNDLSIAHKCQTARMPVPDSDVYNAEEGEFMMKAGDRPQFWYSSQWNPMASLYDIPSAPSLFGTASIYLSAPMTVAYNAQGTLDTNVTVQFAENMTADHHGFITVHNAGFYHITGQVAVTDFGGYYTDPTTIWISPRVTDLSLNTRFLTAGGWGVKIVEAKYETINCECTAYLDAEEIVELYYTFNPDTDNGSISFYGGDPLDPINLGLSSYLQVTWQGPAASSLRRRAVAAESVPDKFKSIPVEYDSNYDIQHRNECEDSAEIVHMTSSVQLNEPAESHAESVALSVPEVPFGYCPVDEEAYALSRQESLCSTVLAGDVVEISTFTSSTRKDNVGTSDGTSEWEMA